MKNAQLASHEVNIYLKNSSVLFSFFVQPTCIRKKGRKNIADIARSQIRGQTYMLEWKWHWIGLPAEEKKSGKVPLDAQ